jgi:hypothetical protein
MQQQTQKLVTIIGSAVVVLVVLLLFVVPFMQHRGKVKVIVQVLPQDSTLFVDNNKTRAGAVYLSHGKHNLRATRQDFETATKSIDTAKLDKDPIVLMPKPTSQAAKDYLENHPEEQAKREAAASDIAAKQQEALKKYPLINDLPYTEPGFEFLIDYDAETNNNGDLVVTYHISASNEDARVSARQWIVDHGGNPDKLNIKYDANLLQDNPNIGHQ